MAKVRAAKGWQFWIDRGGTFTDVVALSPTGEIKVSKLLSVAPERYQDAALQSMREILGVDGASPLPTGAIASIKMGTTVATNALLERQGEPTILVITAGFTDALAIAYQSRPDIFALEIKRPQMLYEHVIEAKERFSAEGDKLCPLDRKALRADLQRAYNNGYRSCAICLMHGYRYNEHERQVEDIARQIGFTQVSTSHTTSPLMKLVSRGDTTLADAYLSPVLRRYVEKVAREVKGTRLLFMQSNGGLADGKQFRGKDAILSGPAGGIIGAIKTSARSGNDKIITFDMGGTSCDVAHYGGELERSLESMVAGVRIRAPMLSINTVAAGGGSLLHFDGCRYRVGPESAGADPGPACYRKDGPLTVTDCNVLLGKIQPAYFPKVFGPSGNEPIDACRVATQFAALAADIHEQTGDCRLPEQVAEGFLSVAVSRMSSAIKQVSVERGYQLSEYTLFSFGGAGGQHACLIAEALDIKRICIHPFSGVLSAYGIGLADLRTIKECSIEKALSQTSLKKAASLAASLKKVAATELTGLAGECAAITFKRRARLRYAGEDFSVSVDLSNQKDMEQAFAHAHKLRFGCGFDRSEEALILEAIEVEAIGKTFLSEDLFFQTSPSTRLSPVTVVRMYTRDSFHATPLFRREHLSPGDQIYGPAIIVESSATTIVEPSWVAVIDEQANIIISRDERQASPALLPAASKPLLALSDQEPPQACKSEPAQPMATLPDRADPVLLEIFNNLFMSSAEQMGITLQNTSQSVNIRERLDFSCAIFDGAGNLIANAPHIPVHLGSMGEAVQHLIAHCQGKFRPGDVYATNDPFAGGTHLPDITVIWPVFIESSDSPLFFTAARGHHADIGGITPGSMPPGSTTIEQEGILISNFLLVDKGNFALDLLEKMLSLGAYPARNPRQNIADLKAQIAACNKGQQELEKMISHFGLDTVKAYMSFVQDNAEECVRRVIDGLDDGSYSCRMDNGATISASIKIDRKARCATIDFSGSSLETRDNFNAPSAVSKAAVLYVFRTLVQADIPLNAGCMKPLTLIIPEGSIVNPALGAAVVAGNVETSQVIVDTLYGALAVMAAAQGTMNNFTFGNDLYQYYETICGGAGAGATFDGADAVQTHMTNSRLTDPEVLEWRFPVLVDSFSIRKGSGGAGHHHGGNGVVRRIKFRQPMTASILSGRRTVAPAGLKGGENGLCGKNFLEREDGTVVPLASTDTAQMQAGDIFVIITPGGGGFGSADKKNTGCPIIIPP